MVDVRSNHILFANSSQSNNYKLSRPTYPTTLYDTIFSELKKTSAAAGRQSKLSLDTSPTYDLAVDIATGTGQVVDAIVSHFKHILATDISKSQLSEAKPHPNVTYQCRDASDTGLSDTSVDLITVGQAMHWFDQPAFFSEAARILRPGGLLAYWTYDFGHLTEPGSPEDAVFRKLRWGTLNGYWAPGMDSVVRKYEDVYPGDYFKAIQRYDLKLDDVYFNIDDMANYTRSWSGYQTYRKKNPSHDPVDDLYEGMAKVVKQRRDVAATAEAATNANRFLYRRALTLFIAHTPKLLKRA
eukprot:CAMPEP_0175084218 /NCGR_PEP_ID=MMETSP0052_2-20121109/27915_1 /TAXON_ID=51329 ORGANISM="Polytomella parva, Strain SAG 63-3" /NCGR_SAMPLE_ID=MMETSP0052_2 /ASSEMBLY_ACC=CAM_ASM_000194 /LENGTH=297 /DNA_ID=CAMNT_0016355953 /DNA_START=170 /DNA_END=1063 /DNA_ORIENTATION=-